MRIGTRGSALALYQANLVADLLRTRCGLACELVILKTAGDVDQSRPVAELGQVGVFVKELERALLAGEVDLAVHSLKDLPTDLPPGLVLAAQPERVDVHDLLLIHPGAFDEAAEHVPLRAGARVGTSSLRRRVQLLEVRPDLAIVPVRGNVPTRVDKARTGELEAVVLAAAGVTRLGLDLTTLRPWPLPPDRFVPAPGQAALGLEARADDERLLRALAAALHDPEVARATAAERQLLHGLGAGCSVPLGAHALPGADGRLLLRAVLGPPGTPPRPRLRRALVRALDPAAAAELALRVLDPPPGPLAGQALDGKRVLLLRDPARGDELAEALEALGAEARCRPATETRPLADPGHVSQAVRDLPAGSWVLLASPQAAQAFAAALDEPARAALFHLRLGAVGPATARELAEADLPLDLLARQADGAGLAEELLAQGAPPPAVLLPAARLGRAELGEALAAAGVRVERLALYATEPRPPLTPGELERVDALVVFAPSAARAALEGVKLPPACAVVAIGPTTAAELAFLGHPAREVADTPTPAGVMAALARVLAHGA